MVQLPCFALELWLRIKKVSRFMLHNARVWPFHPLTLVDPDDCQVVLLALIHRFHRVCVFTFQSSRSAHSPQTLWLTLYSYWRSSPALPNLMNSLYAFIGTHTRLKASSKPSNPLLISSSSSSPTSRGYHIRHALFRMRDQDYNLLNCLVPFFQLPASLIAL